MNIKGMRSGYFFLSAAKPNHREVDEIQGGWGSTGEQTARIGEAVNSEKKGKNQSKQESPLPFSIPASSVHVAS